MSLSRRSLNSFDWLWFLALLALAGAGLVTIWSSTEGTGLNSYFGRQAIYLAFALALYLGLLYLDYHFFADHITFLYLAGLVLLAAVLFIGRTVHNTKGWIALGMLSFQPSELVKLLVILALAKYYSEIEREHLTLSELLKGGLIVLVPMLLVVLQGDLGTAVTFVPIFFGLSFIAGVRRKHVLVVLAVALACSPLGWMKLKDYQRGPHPDGIQPEQRSSPSGLSNHSVEDSDWIRQIPRQGVQAGISGTTGLSSRAAHRFCFCGRFRGAGVPGEHFGSGPFPIRFYTPSAHGTRSEGQDWGADCRGSPGPVSFSRHGQCRNGHRIAPHYRNTAPPVERGGVLADFHLPGHESLHEHPDAPLCQLSAGRFLAFPRVFGSSWYSVRQL